MNEQHPPQRAINFCIQSYLFNCFFTYFKIYFYVLQFCFMCIVCILFIHIEQRSFDPRPRIEKSHCGRTRV